MSKKPIDMEIKKMFPTTCPCCGGELHVRSLCCTACETTVSGDYRLPPFMRLTPDEQAFLLEFVASSGSLKELASRRGLSYPTLRNRLDDLIDKLEKMQDHEPHP